MVKKNTLDSGEAIKYKQPSWLISLRRMLNQITLVKKY